MVSRVPTYNQHQILLSNILTTKDSLNKLSNQLTSGLKSDSFLDISYQASQLLGVQDLIDKTTQYQKNIDTLSTRLSFVENNMKAINRVAANFKTALETLSSSSTPPTLQTQATAYLKEINQYLNERDSTRYLFGGSQTTNQTPMQDLTRSPPTSLTLSGSMEVTGLTGIQAGATISTGGGTALVLAVTNNAGGARLSLSNITAGFTGSGAVTTTPAGGTATSVAGSYTTQDQATITLTNATTNTLTPGTLLTDANGGTAEASNLTTLSNGDIRVTLTKISGNFGMVQGSAITGTGLAGATSATTRQINNLIPAPTLANLSFVGAQTGGSFSVGDTIVDSQGHSATVSAVTPSTTGGLVRVYVSNAGGVNFAVQTGTITNTTSGASTVARATPPVADNYTVKIASATLGAANLQVGQVLVQGANEAVVTNIDTANGLLTLRTYTPSSGPQSSAFLSNSPLVTSNNSLAVTDEKGNAIFATGIITDSIKPDVTTSYYTNLQGAAESPQSAKISDDVNLTYGIGADNQAFEQIIRVLNYFATTKAPQTNTDAFTAYQTQAQAGISTLRTALSNLDGVQSLNAFSINNLKDKKDDNTHTLKLSQDTKDSILNADSTSVGVEIQAIQTQLQASYALLGKIKDLSLVNYL